ncbi:response regulator [Paenibacillus segetis]|uniref:Two-component system, response regulator YesN n=1 Tax=Paenibacillus segetis TaxID=1325360 RepID=A0ABQ1Y3A1_9BACL|nr:response regulator [Paenibacillus segetis]GGH10262.1 hypothetical protein GCM10008013_01640 [Paenibacillus segetis]
MYKLLIVDDEALVREAIQDQMDWEKLGFECIGGCEDGIEALDFINHHTPDVVLTDIGMPFMNGIELTSELSTRYPQIKVIILTGYDDFDFAQQALKLQAVDYILKPITAAELETVIRKLRHEMDLEQSQIQDYEHLKRQLMESLPLLKERFLERLATSPMTGKQMREGFSYFHIEWNGSFVIELAIDVDEFELSLPSTLYDEELIRFAIYNIAQEVIANRSGILIFRDRENRVLILISGDHAEELYDQSTQVADEIHSAITNYLPVKLSIGIGHVCNLADKVPRFHHSALSALDYRFVIGTNRIIYISDMEQRKRAELISIVDWENELITKLKTGTTEEMDEWIEQLFITFREHVYPLDICQMYLQRILLTIMHTLYAMGIDNTQVFGDTQTPIHEITRFAVLDEVELRMKDLCAKVVAIIKNMRERQSMALVAKAIEYVKQEYMDPNLSLKSVCHHVSMSSSYFSSLFKQTNGTTFIEFVTHLRMEKAKELLNVSSMKSYEIAYAVGYNDPHYFSGAFKKHTGETPTDYRQKMTRKV